MPTCPVHAGETRLRLAARVVSPLRSRSSFQCNKLLQFVARNTVSPHPTDDDRALTLAPPTYCAQHSCYYLNPSRSPELALEPSDVTLRAHDVRIAGRGGFAFPSRAPLECSLLLRSKSGRCYSCRSLAAAKWETRHVAHVLA